MKSAFLCFAFSFFLIFQSCAPNQVDENIKRREEIIAIHDEVMPKMGQLKSLEKTALQMSTDISNSSTPDESKIQELKNLALELDQAYEDMFVWMRQYEVEDGDQTPEAVKTYLDDQMKLITEVNQKIKVTLTKADSLLKVNQ